MKKEIVIFKDGSYGVRIVYDANEVYYVDKKLQLHQAIKFPLIFKVCRYKKLKKAKKIFDSIVSDFSCKVVKV